MAGKLSSTRQGPNCCDSKTFHDYSIRFILIPPRTLSAPQDTNKYLFYRASDNCFQCVALWSRHTNVLEYKAGECGETEDPEALCDISPDAALNTMVRVDGANIPCPIQVRSQIKLLLKERNDAIALLHIFSADKAT